MTITSLTRRDFLVYGGATLAGVTLGGAGRRYLALADARVARGAIDGAGHWRVSVCRECPAACGIRVRVVNSVPVKVEGNPSCPISRGRLCARGQASIESYFDPDRLLGPVKRTGEGARARFERIGWDDALHLVVEQLQAVMQCGGRRLAIGAEERGPLAHAWSTFWTAAGAEVTAVPLPTAARLRPALRALTNVDAEPVFDLEHATHVLSFGAPLVEDWLSPVWSQRSYGRFRRGDPHGRGRLVQVDARRSMTARKADEWIAVAPDQQVTLAYGIAAVLVREHRIHEAFLGEYPGNRVTFEASLGVHYPADAVAAATGVPVVTILRLARELATTAQPLAIVAADADPRLLEAVFALNALLGAFERPGGIHAAVDSPAAASEARATWPPAEGADFVALRDASPLRSLNAWSAMGDARFVVSFSPYLDEAALVADVVLPMHTPLEAWHGVRPAASDVTERLAASRPAVSPRLETRDLADVLRQLAGRLDGPASQACDWQNSETLIRGALTTVFGLRRGTAYAGLYETEWIRQLEAGGWWSTETRSAEAFGRAVLDAGGWVDPFAESGFIRQALKARGGVRFPSLGPVAPAAPLEAREGRRVRLVPYVPPVFSLTGSPNQPVIFELLGQPDFEPWEVWAELSPETARELGVAAGDLIRIVGEHASIEARAQVIEGTPAGTVVVPHVPALPHAGRWARHLQADVRTLVSRRAPHETVLVEILRV